MEVTDNCLFDASAEAGAFTFSFAEINIGLITNCVQNTLNGLFFLVKSYMASSVRQFTVTVYTWDSLTVWHEEMNLHCRRRSFLLFFLEAVNFLLQTHRRRDRE